MKHVLDLLEKLKQDKISQIIFERMKEFEKLGKSNDDEIFKELCFCLLTANFSAEGGIKIQREIEDGFFILGEDELAKNLAVLGHRFPNTRAKFIFSARPLKNSLKNKLASFKNEPETRNWLVENIKGLGMKEASHFLRNIGYKNLAIIDFHIIEFLVRNRLINKPKTLSRKKYLEIEEILREIAEKSGLSLGELDLYLWYHETGKVLK